MTDGNGERILIVDDEEHIREVLERGLRRGGYECATAGSSDAAVEQLVDGDTFDLLLLDIRMPGKSGIDFLPEVKAQHPNMAVMMLTAVDEVSTAVRSMQDGAYDYVLKPVSMAELVVRVDQLSTLGAQFAFQALGPGTGQGIRPVLGVAHQPPDG